MDYRHGDHDRQGGLIPELNQQNGSPRGAAREARTVNPAARAERNL